MNLDETLDETLDDVRKVLHARGKKCLLIYGDHGTEKPISVKFSASLLDLNSLAASAVLCVATELSNEFGYDKATAVEMAINSIADQVRCLTGIEKPDGS
jgi:hypothetical protein